MSEGEFLTTSLRSKLSNTVLSSWTQASWSGLLEWSSSCPLSWSVTSGRSTSRQSVPGKNTELAGSNITFSVNGADLTNLYVGVMPSRAFFFFLSSSCAKCHYVVFEPRGLLPGCLKRSLSTILHMQPSFWRTSWESGMLSINFARRTLQREWKESGKGTPPTSLVLFTFHI